MHRGWIIFLATLLLLSACAPATPVNHISTETPPVNLTGEPSATITPVMAASSLNVQKEALRGVQVKVWHPYFCAEASLF